MAAESLKKAIAAAAAAKKAQGKTTPKTAPKTAPKTSSTPLSDVKQAYITITNAGHAGNMNRIDLQKKVKTRARIRKDLHKVNGQLATLATSVCKANQAAAKTLTDLLKQPENMPAPDTYGPAVLKEHIISAGLWPLATKGNNKGKPMGIPALKKSTTAEYQALGRGFATLAAIASRLNKQQTASKPAAAPGFVAATMGGKPAASKPDEPLVKTVYKKDLLKQGSQAPTAAERKAVSATASKPAPAASKPAPAASKPAPAASKPAPAASKPAPAATSRQQTIVPVPSVVLAAINKMTAGNRQLLFDQLASLNESVRTSLKIAIAKAETEAIKNA